MGQYYKPVSLDKKEYMYTHDFREKITRDDGTSYTAGQGLKLMEHSYIGNMLMNAIERMLIPGGDWYKTKIVWAGDYADHEKGHKKAKDGYDVNIYSIMEEKGKQIKPSSRKVSKKYRYLTNHTKKVIVDLTKIKDIKGDRGYKIHPLSLLVCEGNGRGGGDFRGEDERIGSWARDIISLEDEVLYNAIVDGQFVEGENHGVTMKSGKASAMKPDMVIRVKK